MSFGPTAPLQPYILTSVGQVGCTGGPGSGTQNGGSGLPGQGGGQIVGTNTGLTIFGTPVTFGLSIGAFVQADGGSAGSGGEAGYAGNSSIIGGTGGIGGNGGTVSLPFNGNFTSDANNPPATIGLYATALGGAGGNGGTSALSGIYIRLAGDAAAGGNGGSVTLNASESVVAEFGVEALAIGGVGGVGGLAQTNDVLDETVGGNGGNGGNGGAASAQWLSGTITAVQGGVSAESDGGAAGNGGSTLTSINTQGGTGGAGGMGGTASALVAAGTQIAVSSDSVDNSGGTSVYVTANGGAGGMGGLAGDALGAGGGSGGAGGAGGSASATILGSVAFTGLSGPGVANGIGVLVQANGGAGGGGTNTTAAFGEAGSGGPAGNGGTASLTIGDATNTGTITTSGDFVHAAVVQNVGGGGGSGGQAVFSSAGGSGAAGGNGGPVSVTSGHALVIAAGNNSDAVIAQSIGGGGGTGGDATGTTVVASLIIGGNGGLGGNGGPVTLNLGENSVFASTTSLGGGGILAQSIGGSGGNAGSASATGGGIISITIGGDAGGGGSGGNVKIDSAALVTTYGDHAAGLQAQSIGGGGGKGGTATTFLVSPVPAAAVAVGGRGGGGGPAGDVSLTNTGQITTYGADSPGILMQSIGGGGGTGGAAVARAVALSPTNKIPAISISVATGGTGGGGNTGGTVTLNNSGLVTTAGDGGIGVMAQSIGGGGGNAGDSTAASYAAGPQGGLAVSIAVAVGGTGGLGGTGNTVDLANSGVILTLGQDAYGVFAQSVGGGGGTGGAGDATAYSTEAKGSFSATIAVGGGGGTGGDSGVVGLTNSGSILTRGDGADAVFAQSVGGGGGAAGGGTATASGNNLSIAVGVGGSGGAGGNGNTASVTNRGNVITRGTDAIALSVQSIGGGGGKAGKGGATAGGLSNSSSAQALLDVLEGGLGASEKVTKITDNVLQIGEVGEDIKSSLEELKGLFSQPQAGQSQEGTATKINVAVSVGGNGGAAGVGGTANVTNTGSIGTFGTMSHGIFAQSVGGGGGAAGAASSTGSSSDDSQTQASVGVGGNGGAGGSGGTVTVVNGTGGSILTQGVLSFGIAAQSIGGGGGTGAIAGTINGSLASLGVGVGGNGGANGDGGEVDVTTGDGTTGSSITTTGKHGIAILAESVGGGGGLVESITTNETFDPSLLVNNPQGRLADIHGLSLTFGGQNGASGKGGPVTVTVSGPITTAGLDAHAIVAQSIGGGGGIVVGGLVTLLGPVAGAGNAAGGNGGLVTVKLQPGTTITTTGNGAFGVLAQSIGGGGGVAGDFSAVQTYVTGTLDTIKANPGDGGSVVISANGTTISAQGAYGPAIFAQSIGGGGGLLEFNASGAPQIRERGTAGGAGSGGPITISLVNSYILGGGPGSAAIVAQSDGQRSGSIQISIDSTSQVLGGYFETPSPSQSLLERDDAAIRLLGGTNNQIVNAGTIVGLGQPSTSYAVLASGPTGNTTLTNTGSITGNISLSGVGSTLDNRLGGTVNAPVAIDLGGGLLRNGGTLHVGGLGTVGQTTITGNLVQTSTGTLIIDLAAGANASDHLQVNGSAVLDGAVVAKIADPANLHTGTRQTAILSATGGVVRSGTFSVASSTPVLRYGLAAPDANTLDLTYTVDFSGTLALGAVGLSSANRAEVGRALNAIFAGDGGALEPLVGELALLQDPQSLASALDILSGQGVADVQQAVFTTQQTFTNTVLRHVTTGESGPPGTGGGSYAEASLTPIAGPDAGVDRGLRIWLGGFGGSDVLSATEGLASLHTQIAGAMVGLDKWFDQDRMAGFSVGGGSTTFDVSNVLAQGSTTSALASVYGLARFGRAYLSGIAAYGYYTSDVHRTHLGSATTPAASANANLSSNVLGGRIEAGWRQPVGPVTVTPFAALEVDQQWQSGLTESAYVNAVQVSPLSLHFASESQASVPFTLGGRVSSDVHVGRYPLHISAELGWVHEFNPQRQVTASFLSAPDFPFRVLGASPSENAAITALDARLSLTRRVALLANFTGRFSGIETAVAGFGGLQVSW